MQASLALGLFRPAARVDRPRRRVARRRVRRVEDVPAQALARAVHRLHRAPATRISPDARRWSGKQART
jgi:hypothetical protein